MLDEAIYNISVYAGVRREEQSDRVYEGVEICER
jgi:hypothetical protein